MTKILDLLMIFSHGHPESRNNVPADTKSLDFLMYTSISIKSAQSPIKCWDFCFPVLMFEDLRTTASSQTKALEPVLDNLLSGIKTSTTFNIRTIQARVTTWTPACNFYTDGDSYSIILGAILITDSDTMLRLSSIVRFWILEFEITLLYY